jgi:hypothetical protein
MMLTGGIDAALGKSIGRVTGAKKGAPTGAADETTAPAVLPAAPVWPTFQVAA